VSNYDYSANQRVNFFFFLKVNFFPTFNDLNISRGFSALSISAEPERVVVIAGRHAAQPVLSSINATRTQVTVSIKIGNFETKNDY
jgi:hypothetical protein